MLALKRGLFALMALLCLIFSIDPALALISGVAVRYLLGSEGVGKVSKIYKWLLQIIIVLLGFSLNTHQVILQTKKSLPLITFSVLAVFITGFVLSKVLKSGNRISFLISSGTAICGGSAIASMSAVLGSSSRDTSSALGVVFVLNALAIFVFPWAGNILNMSESQFGLWCAVAIHDTSSVIAAASAFGKEALEIATTVKIVRAMWILPLVFIVALWPNSQGKIRIPWFIVLFVLAVVLTCFIPFSAEFRSLTFNSSKSIMSAVLFLMGADLSYNDLRRAGYKPIILGILLWVFIGISTALLICSFY